MKEVFRVENVSKNGILDGVSFSMQEGELTAVMGPSGAGKSTLLYNVSGMDVPDGGQVFLCGTEVTALSEDEKAELRLRRTGFVFQQMNVIARLGIMDNILLPANHARKGKKARKENEARAMELMKLLGIERLAGRGVSEVSGGELQRACICRGMMMEPELLFADEPTGALNQSAAKDVMQAFLRLNQKGTSILMVTHDSMVASCCDRILYLLDGKIKGELALGKWKEEEKKEREDRVREWLSGFGW